MQYTLDTAVLIWPTSSRRRHIDKPEADCDLTPRTTLHHVGTKFGERAFFYTQDQQPGTLYLLIYLIYDEYKRLQP